eukprot:g47801.t1
MSLASRIKENPKACYLYIRRKRVASARVNPLKDKGGNLCIELEKVGEVLNEYFTLVFTKEKDMGDDKIREGYVDILDNVNIKKEEVLGILKIIKVDKSPRPDGIYPRILGEAREEIAGSLTEIFVSSLATGWSRRLSHMRSRSGWGELRGDLMEVYKSMRGVDRVDNRSLLVPRVKTSNSTGYRFK